MFKKKSVECILEFINKKFNFTKNFVFILKNMHQRYIFFFITCMFYNSVYYDVNYVYYDILFIILTFWIIHEKPAKNVYFLKYVFN